jgi:phospholipase C
VFRVPAGTTPVDHTSVLKTIEVRWDLPSLTARDAAAPDLGDALTLDTPRTDDPLAGVAAPVSTGANPAAGTVSHLVQVQAELVSNLPAPLERVQAAPLLVHQHSPADFDHYIAARTALWRSSREDDAEPPA